MAAGAIVVLLFGLATPALAQGDTAQVEFDADSAILIDGVLDDWADVAVVVTEDGPEPSDDPSLNGSLNWQVVAEPGTVYFAATITDEVIVAGEHGENYWNEDSIEFYLNLSGDLALTEYGPGVAQVRVSPVDIGNTNPAALTLSGNGIEQVAVEGLVFATDSGWGTEIAVDVSGIAQPTAGDTFGLQVHANGSSAGDRDLKLIWASADVEDTSFRDPSVFGQGVFADTDGDVGDVVSEADAEPPATEGAEAEVPDTEAVVETATDDAPEQVAQVDSIAEDDPDIITGEEQQRSLLYAAIASSIAVLGGGVFFERKRKKDEARLGGKPLVETASAGAAGDGQSEVTDDETEAEFQAMLDSILDDPK